jgi:putative ABC transport system permease protein
MKGAWKLALRNLSRNRRRNLVTGLALAVGYAGLVLLAGYAVRVERLLRASAVYVQHTGHVAVYAPGGLERAEVKPSAYALPAAAADRIEAALRADPRVELTGRYLQGSGIAGNGCRSYPVRPIGLDLEAERRIQAHPEVLGALGPLARPRIGRALTDLPPDAAAVVLAGRVARFVGKAPAGADPAPGDPASPLDCQAGDASERIAADPWLQLAVRTQDGAFGAADVWIAGVFQAPTLEADKSSVVGSLATVQRLFDTDRVTYLAAYLRDPRQAAAVARDVTARLAADGLEIAAYPFDDARLNPYYAGTLGFLGAIVIFIGTLVATVVALSVLNAMTLAVLERSRELGTFRALGFTRRQVLSVLLREAVLLAGLALAGGLALGLAAAAAVNAANVQFEPPGVGGRIQLLVTPDPVLSLVLGAVLLGLSVAATWVAVRRKVRERVATLVAEVAA